MKNLSTNQILIITAILIALIFALIGYFVTGLNLVLIIPFLIFEILAFFTVLSFRNEI
jgi:hypothetical protein